jgi:IPTL-CTERM motif
MKLRSIYINCVFLLSLLCSPLIAWSQSPLSAGIREPAEARISGLPITLGVGFISLCYELVPPFNYSSIVTVHRTPGIVTIRVMGYCPPLFVAVAQGRSFSLNDLPPGIYDVRYEFYNFDGSFVSEGLMPGYDSQNQRVFPFTILAPTQENLDRVFRVPTLSQFGLAALALLVGILGLRYFRKRAS